MKPDRGINNFQLEQNPDSLYRDKLEFIRHAPALQSLAEFTARHPELEHFPAPEDVGIRSLARI